MLYQIPEIITQMLQVQNFKLILIQDEGNIP